jgi:hypothetical protein
MRDKNMATKQQIKNLVDMINRDYVFRNENGEMHLVWEKGINGYQLALAENTGGSWMVVLTQHETVTSDVCLLILKMVYWDILQRQTLNHYSVSKRVI